MDIKKVAFLEAWTKSFGNITASCTATGISRMTYYRWIEDDKEFKSELEAAKPDEIFMDFIENSLVKKIHDGDTACIIFAAKTKCKKRGYIEKTETEITGIDTIKVIRDPNI